MLALYLQSPWKKLKETMMNEGSSPQVTLGKHTTPSAVFSCQLGFQPHFNPHLLVSQYRQGGPVIAVQVENEYGSFKKDRHYMAYLQEVRTLDLISYLHAPSSIPLLALMPDSLLHR
jgi:hypothetical protein